CVPSARSPPSTLFPYTTLFRSEGVGTVSIGGPYGAKVPGDTPSRRKIFICRPSGSHDEDTCATKIITALARRAYRRPIQADEIPDRKSTRPNSSHVSNSYPVVC